MDALSAERIDLGESVKGSGEKKSLKGGEKERIGGQEAEASCLTVKTARVVFHRDVLSSISVAGTDTRRFFPAKAARRDAAPRRAIRPNQARETVDLRLY